MFHFLAAVSCVIFWQCFSIRIIGTNKWTELRRVLVVSCQRKPLPCVRCFCKTSTWWIVSEEFNRWIVYNSTENFLDISKFLVFLWGKTLVKFRTVLKYHHSVKAWTKHHRDFLVSVFPRLGSPAWIVFPRLWLAHWPCRQLLWLVLVVKKRLKKLQWISLPPSDHAEYLGRRSNTRVLRFS